MQTKEIYLNETQLALSKLSQVFKKRMKSICILYAVGCAMLIILMTHLQFDLRVLSVPIFIIVGLLALVFIGMAANNFIVYLSVGTGRFNKDLLLYADHDMPIKECLGHVNFVRVLSKAGMIAGAVFLMTLTAIFIALENYYGIKSTVYEFTLGLFFLFCCIPVFIHHNTLNKANILHQAMENKQKLEQISDKVEVTA